MNKENRKEAVKLIKEVEKLKKKDLDCMKCIEDNHQKILAKLKRIDELLNEA